MDEKKILYIYIYMNGWIRPKSHTLYQNKQSYDTCISAYKYTCMYSFNEFSHLGCTDSVCSKTRRPLNESLTQNKGNPLLSCLPLLYIRLSKYTVYCPDPRLTPRNRLQFPGISET